MHKVYLLLLIMLLGACASQEQRPAYTLPPGTASLMELRERAKAAYAQHDFVESRQLYLQLTQAAPSEPTFWFRLANSQVQLGELDVAVESYQQALRLDSRDAKIWHNLGVARLRQAQASLIRSVRVAGGDKTKVGEASASLAKKIDNLRSSSQQASSKGTK